MRLPNHAVAISSRSAPEIQSALIGFQLLVDNLDGTNRRPFVRFEVSAVV